jgi:hypothetical protein
MKRILPKSFKAFLALMLFCAIPSFAQTTVFNDDFEIASGVYYTITPGPIGTSLKWNMSRSGTDFAAGIKDYMKLNNDGSGAANTNGWALAWTNAGNFTSPYQTTLNANPGLITWTFNMRQAQANPSGFTAADYGAAYVLAGTSGTTNLVGTGYAVILGNSGTTDPLKLVRYNAGIRNFTTLITSNTTGLTDFGNQYLSVKVTYAPSTNTWQMFVRNDGAAFSDPVTGTLTSQGTVVNSTYTGAALPIMGCYWNASTASSQIAYFDNVKITVAVPATTSLSPSSKTAGTGAFTLTVNGANFVSGVSTARWNGSNRTTTYVSPTQLTAAITAADIASSGTATITVANGTAVSNPQTFTIDPAGVPVLTLSTNALSGLSTVAGTASSALTYTINGSNLTADPVVTPPANFEVSTNGTTYSNSLTLARTGNILTGQPVTIYTRIKASASAGIYSGNIDHTTTGGASKQVAVSGVVLATQPSAQATAVTFANVTSASFTINWTIGNGAKRIVLIRSGSAVNASPVDGVSYNGMASFGTGSEIGTDNFVVYSGTGNSVAVTGLSAATTYHVAVYEFNGADGTENYLTTSPATGNRTTLNAPVGWQIYTTNIVNTINFDTTVDGVNNDSFQGDGFGPAPEAGELNSKAWAVTGFTDGAVAFGGVSPEGSDFDRSISDGGVTDGGVYAFETSDNNSSLGIQPAAGDFAPGSVTLRFQNQTGAAITSINIGYKVYVYNDQAASSSFNFSHSADNTTYTSVAGLNVASPAAADIAPGWKDYYRVVTITGLNIASNNYYYLRWSGATVSGSVDFDEFALDDIVMVANPTSNAVTFSGTAESLVILGNTILSADATVSSDITFNGGKLDINGKTLTLNGTVTNTTTGGLKGSASSNITIAGAVSPTLSFDQTTLGTTNLLNNFSVNTTSANTVTIGNPIVINGTLATAAGQSLNMGTNALTGTLATISNNGNILTQNTTSLPLPTGKTWSGTGTINYNAASAAQTVVVGTYQGLTVSTTGGATAAGAITVNGILNLPVANPSATTGSLSMATYTLTMGGSATNTGIGDVTGIITRNSIVANTLYTFGHTHTSILFPNTGTLPTSLGLKVVIGAAPSWRTGAIQRTYDFIQTGGSGTKAVIKSHYLDSELNGNNESKLVDWAYIVSSSTTLEQGRSNYNTIDNYTELTNVNVGLYFAPVFDQVRLTLDESEAGVLTWNGSVSNSWTTAVNWTPNATPSDTTVVFIPDAATTPNDPTLNPTVLLGSLDIEPGGILNSGTNSELTIKNGAGAWINNGTFNPGTSTVIFTNADATIGGITNFNNVTINSGAMLRPVTGNIMRIAGQFVNNGGLVTGVIDNLIEYNGTNQTIALPTGSIAAYHNLVVNGTGAIFPASLNVTGDLTLNQSVDFTGKTLAMNGSELQTISGSASQAFNSLTVNNSFGQINLTSNTAINGTLILTAGNLNIGNTILTLGANAVSGAFDSTKMIIAGSTGEVRRTFTGTGSYLFPIGETTGTTDYSPITVNVTAGSFSGAYVGVSVIDAIHPNNSSIENNISRYWKVNQSGITGAAATVTANYTNADIVGAEGNISSAQLNGTFNQQTNPWVKFAACSSNTLTAASATLTSGQASVFTGIKGDAFSVILSGYGAFCQNEAVTLTAVPSGGNAPYTYSWSNGLGTLATAVPPTTTIGTTNYTVTIKDSNGITVSDNNNVTVLAPSVGGSVAGGLTICAGTQPGNLILSGHTGSIAYWQSSHDIGFTSPENISNTTDVLTGATIGNLSQTTYFRAVIQNGSCLEVYSSPATITIKTTTWDGTAWDNGAPDSTTAAVISGNYTSSSDFNACTLIVNNNAVVIIPTGFDVTLNGALTVSSGSFTLQNAANLLQTTSAANSGNIIVRRNSSAIRRQDYTLWSSPVANQNMLAFSPATVVTPTSRFYQYNSSINLYNSIVSPSGVTFNNAQGYLIRVANNHPTWPTIWQGQFTGTPHNGNYSYTMFNGGAGLRFNLVGNPYPSPINAVAFAAANSASITQTLYFWRETNNNTTNNAYCSWSPAGGPSGTFVTNGEAQVSDPNGVIQTGQGFFVEAISNATNVDFTNAMRLGNNTNQFFRPSITASPAESENHRIWLNVTNDTGAFCQTALGYMTGATQGYDPGIDGKYINDGDTELYSVIDTDKYVIQGRALPFVSSDVVPLGFKATTTGAYSIAIDHLDGLFSGSQDIYLKDNLLGTQHDLKSGAYVFTADAGTYTNRFEVVYATPLGTGHHQFDGNSVVIYRQNGNFVINTGSITMDNVKVFDIRGRLLAEQKGINASQATFNAGEVNQVLIVKITSDNNQTVTRKVVN